MKGSSLLTFVIIVSLSFLIVFFISLMAYKYYQNIQKNLKEQETKQVALTLISEIANIYTVGSKLNVYQMNNSITLVEKTINLPEKIAGKNYFIEAISSSGLWSIIATNETIKEEYPSNKIGIIFDDEKYYFNLPNMPVILQGKIKAGSVKITYKRYLIENEIRDAIILGDSDVIIDLTTLQV